MHGVNNIKLILIVQIQEPSHHSVTSHSELKSVYDSSEYILSHHAIIMASKHPRYGWQEETYNINDFSYA
jgi:hypothetical protein